MAHHGDVLNTIIKSKGMTKDGLADKLGINRRTVYLWISKPVLKESIVNRVGSALGIDMAEAAPSVFGNMAHYDINKKLASVNLEGVDFKDKYIMATEQLIECKDRLAKALAMISEIQAENAQLRQQSTNKQTVTA